MPALPRDQGPGILGGLEGVGGASDHREDGREFCTGILTLVSLVAAPIAVAGPNARGVTAAPTSRRVCTTSWSVPGLIGRRRLWRLRVVSIGAFSLNFGFRRFRLPEGARVYFYPVASVPEQAAGGRGGVEGPRDPGRQRGGATPGVPVAANPIWDGPYESADASPDGQFWTAVVPGDDAVIELWVPADAAFEPELVIGQVGHDYRGFASLARALIAPREKQGTCNNDVICPEGDPWRDEIRSVGCYSLGGSRICTGTLVNSHDPDHPPYFLTANHCGVTVSNAASMVVYWNFDSPNCGDLARGSLAAHQAGSELKAQYSVSDFCLVRLSRDPDLAFDVYYAGWDAREATMPASVVCIHHPNCDEKAISFCYKPPTVTTYLQNATPGNGTHWRIESWDDGTTEPGSSGSGLWDPNHRIVGQLHGGYASCTSITSDWFGRFARSWDGGGSANSRLRSWLDPADTGVLFIDGRNWDGGGGTGACCTEAGTCTVTVEAACVLPDTWRAAGTSCTPSPCPVVARFTRGDVDASGEQNISDPIFNLAYQFAGGPPPPCLDAADCDDSGEINISDALCSLCYQFADCPDPPAPNSTCGPDPTPDLLDCASFPPCDGKARAVPPMTEAVDGSRRLLLEMAPRTSPDTLSLTVAVMTDVPLAGLEGMVGYDPTRLQFVRFVKDGSGSRMDFLSARDLPDPPRVRLGGVPDFGLAETLAPGTYEIGRLVFIRRGPMSSLNGAVWLTEGRFVGQDLRAYRIEGGPSVDPADPGAPGGDSGAGPVATTLRVAPTPFTRSTTMRLAGPAATSARVLIFDAVGRLVRTAWDGNLDGREMTIVWDGRDQSGREVPAGIYLVRVKSTAPAGGTPPKGSTSGEATGRLVKMP
jgi:hypothetical protein